MSDFDAEGIREVLDDLDTRAQLMLIAMGEGESAMEEFTRHTSYALVRLTGLLREVTDEVERLST